jgi:hypothetical protein
MLYLLQVPQLSTGNPRLDAIAQAAALGISLAGVIVATFGKKKATDETATPPRKTTAKRPKVAITTEAVDELGARR